MYLVQTDDCDGLARIATDLDALNDFPHIDLGSLNTLSLMEICPEAADWIAKNPVAFDEERGVAIFGVAAAVAGWLLQNTALLTDFGVDVGAVRDFANLRGPFFAVDTF
jgi:hypothetical protein